MFLTFRFAGQNANLRENADAFNGGGMMRQARCMIPASDDIIEAVQKQLSKFDTSSWFYNETQNSNYKNKSSGWSYQCVAVIDLFYCDRPYVVDPYNDPGCVYVSSQCVEYAWVEEDTGDDPFGGGSDNGDPCAPCDSSGPGICEEQGGNGVIPESCSTSFGISLITDPCELAELLEDDTEFRQKMGELFSKANSDSFESGYIFKKENSGTTYTSIQGNAGEPFIDYEFSNVMDGFLHNHYDDDDDNFSTFSGNDIRALYGWLLNGKINNTATFTMGLVTFYGTSYLLKIDDLAKFQEFGLNHLADEDDFATFDAELDQFYLLYTNFLNPQDGGESALLRMLEDNDSGLKLFKGNSNFTDWKAREFNSNGDSVINGNCN